MAAVSGQAWKIEYLAISMLSWSFRSLLIALVGVMFMVVVGTFAWNSIRTLFKVPRADALVIVVVTGVTVIEDLAVAVIVGVYVVVDGRADIHAAAPGFWHWCFGSGVRGRGSEVWALRSGV